jgi:cytochrome c oxidase assembly protein subunit 15
MPRVKLMEPLTISQRLLYWTALATAVLAMLPVGVGAVVTTVDAGMAFPDWPTSDGQGMLAFPWLKSTGDAFLEHGHRLAGMLTGVASIVLVVVAFLCDTRWSVRWMAVGVLLGVIAQGVLGGLRVVADSRELAMIHGQFAAWVFSLMCVIVVAASRSGRARVTSHPAGVSVFAWSSLMAVAMVIQYTLGGLLRHLGHAESWLIHPWFAIVVVISGLATAWSARSINDPFLRRWMLVVLGCLLAQSALGVATWAVRYGYPQFGWMAIQQTSLQTAIRSLHKVVGMVAFMAVMLTVVRSAAIAMVSRRSIAPVPWTATLPAERLA